MGVVHRLFAVYIKCYCTVCNVHVSEELETKDITQNSNNETTLSSEYFSDEFN